MRSKHSVFELRAAEYIYRNPENPDEIGIPVEPLFAALKGAAKLVKLLDQGNLDEERGITEETIRTLFEIAGQRIGLLSFRPGKGGPFSRFRLILFKIVVKK